MNTYTYDHHPEPAEFGDYDTDDDTAYDTAYDTADDTAYEADRAPTITVTPRQVADLAELLDELDEFLRMGEHSIDALTEYYRSRHDDYHPRFTALCLLDSVSFTALCLRRQAQAAVNQTARDQEAADQ